MASGESGSWGPQGIARSVRHAIRKESWGRTVLQLAWTAGPVTFLALQGGYVLGYGRSAPPNLIIYFAAYTLIAGVTAIVVRVLYNATQGRELEEGDKALRGVVSRLPLLLLAARDAALHSYSPEDARAIAAYHLLANPDAREVAIGIAVEQLGASTGLASALRRIETYQRHGLYTLVAQEQERHKKELRALEEKLAVGSPDLAMVFAERSQGRPPSKARGRARLEGFLERALAAGSEDELELLGGGDVQEILSLTMELLAGRTFPLLLFHFRGAQRVSAAWAEADKARREYRSRLRSRNSRLRTAAEALTGQIDDVLPGVSQIGDARSLLDSVVRALEDLVSRVARLGALRRPTRETERLVAQARKAVQRYAELERATDDLSRAHRRLAETIDRYEHLLREELGELIDDVNLTDHEKGMGLWIDERELYLRERDRRTVAREIRKRLEAAHLWDTERVTLDVSAFRELAVGLVGVLERHVPLYRTEIQQAIELSRAPFFEALEPGLSADVRYEWVFALVNEIHDDVAAYALRRVEQLIRLHGLRLAPEALQALSDRFGLSPADLQEMQRRAGLGPGTLPSAPLPVPRVSQQLHRRLTQPKR